MGKYRDRLQIIADVLSAAAEGAKKVHIMYRANLSYALLSRYLKEVVNSGLIALDSGDRYGLTRRGREFLERFSEYSKRYNKIQEQLNDVNNERTALKKMVDDGSAGE